MNNKLLIAVGCVAAFFWILNAMGYAYPQPQIAHLNTMCSALIQEFNNITYMNQTLKDQIMQNCEALKGAIDKEQGR